jgi:DNA-binding GntR family transcriptional regulator
MHLDAVTVFVTMTERTADHIRETLEQAILTGEFKDGVRLDEVRLCTRFGVSRTPVREALHQLAASGLLEMKPRRGAFVRMPGFVEVVEMFEVMGELESMCGRLAAKRISDSQLQAFSLACGICEQAEAAGDSDAYYRENETFHQILYEASGNGFLQSQALQLQKRLQPFRRLQLRVRGRIRQSLDEHRQILKAVEDGDGETAGLLLRQHVTVQGEKFFDLMRGLDETSVRKTG